MRGILTTLPTLSFVVVCTQTALVIQPLQADVHSAATTTRYRKRLGLLRKLAVPGLPHHGKFVVNSWKICGPSKYEFEKPVHTIFKNSSTENWLCDCELLESWKRRDSIYHAVFW